MSEDMGYNDGVMGESEQQGTPQLPQQAQPQPDVQPLPAPQPSVPFPLQQNEHVIQLVRRHWWFLWPYTVWLVIVALAPVAVLAWASDAIGVLDNLNWFFWIPAILWIGYWGFRALFNWYRYQNDIWVVTNQRLIDVFRSNPFNKRVGNGRPRQYSGHEGGKARHYSYDPRLLGPDLQHGGDRGRHFHDRWGASSGRAAAAHRPRAGPRTNAAGIGQALCSSPFGLPHGLASDHYSKISRGSMA